MRPNGIVFFCGEGVLGLLFPSPEILLKPDFEISEEKKGIRIIHDNFIRIKTKHLFYGTLY